MNNLLVSKNNYRADGSLGLAGGEEVVVGVPLSSWGFSLGERWRRVRHQLFGSPLSPSPPPTSPLRQDPVTVNVQAGVEEQSMVSLTYFPQLFVTGILEGTMKIFPILVLQNNYNGHCRAVFHCMSFLYQKINKL